MAISAASAKDKGRRLQNWTAAKIGELLGLPVGRDEMIAPREMGQNGTDVRLIGEAKRRFPWAVECKNQETWAIPSWIVQAKANKDKDTNWLLIVSKNRHDKIAIMDADVFFAMQQRLLELEASK